MSERGGFDLYTPAEADAIAELRAQAERDKEYRRTLSDPVEPESA